jgi:hypothetical protein
MIRSFASVTAIESPTDSERAGEGAAPGDGEGELHPSSERATTTAMRMGHLEAGDAPDGDTS